MKPNLIAYETDASLIEGNVANVLFPKNAEEVKRFVIAGNNLVPRGSGSGLAGGAVPIDSIVLDMSKMNKLIRVDETRMIAEVEPGIILDELNLELAKRGLEFPVNPSSHAIATIGGMIATNAVGSRAIKYGRTSNWVSSIEVVNGKGEILEIGKADLMEFSGMEGITGIITKAKLKLIRKRLRTASVMKSLDIVKIIETIKKLKAISEVSMIEFFDKKTSKIMGLGEEYHLIVEFESEQGKLKGLEYEKVMGIRDSSYPKLAGEGYSVIEDPKIFLEKVPEFLDYLERQDIPVFGHLGVGILHPCFKRGDKRIEEVMLLTKKLHGQVTGEHGYGLSKKKFIEPSDAKLIERVKKRHDPFNKINPNKVIDTKIKKEKVKKDIAEESLENFEENEENETINNKEQEKLEIKEAIHEESINNADDAEELMKNNLNNGIEEENGLLKSNENNEIKELENEK
jgi:FAD/FMN-containing dehydrogenase